MSEMGSIIQGGGIVLSGALVWKLIDVGLKVWEARHQKTETEVKPNPLNVHMEEDPEKKFVTREDFRKHVENNTREHEALYSRMNRNDRETSEIKGLLTAIREDIQLIKGKLFKTSGR